MKRVRCIDASSREYPTGKGPPLVLGKIYEVEYDGGGLGYTLVGVGDGWSPLKNRFEVVPDNGCPQCGLVHL